MNWSDVRPYTPYIITGLLFLWVILGLVELWLKRGIVKEIQRLIDKH